MCLNFVSSNINKHNFDQNIPIFGTSVSFSTDYPFLFVSFGWPQLYNAKAFPFTYGQYVAKELADKLYNSVTVFVLCESMSFT